MSGAPESAAATAPTSDESPGPAAVAPAQRVQQQEDPAEKR
jgi:hypothetical protein